MDHTKLMSLLNAMRQEYRARSRAENLPVGLRAEYSAAANAMIVAARRVSAEWTPHCRHPQNMRTEAIAELADALQLTPEQVKTAKAWANRWFFGGGRRNRSTPPPSYSLARQKAEATTSS